MPPATGCPRCAEARPFRHDVPADAGRRHDPGRHAPAPRARPLGEQGPRDPHRSSRRAGPARCSWSARSTLAGGRGWCRTMAARRTRMQPWRRCRGKGDGRRRRTGRPPRPDGAFAPPIIAGACRVSSAGGRKLPRFREQRLAALEEGCDGVTGDRRTLVRCVVAAAGNDPGGEGIEILKRGGKLGEEPRQPESAPLPRTARTRPLAWARRAWSSVCGSVATLPVQRTTPCASMMQSWVSRCPTSRPGNVSL